MSRKLVLLAGLIVIVVGMLGGAFNVQRAEASGTIYIRADGSIDPDTAPISSVGNVTYTFTGNINDSIVVERSNVIVEGNNYKLQGTGMGGKGFTLVGDNITIKNTVVTGFDAPGGDFAAAIYSFETSSNSIINNTIINNKWGINLEWVTGYLISGKYLRRP